MTTTTYKGIAVLTGLIVAGTLWFQRTGPAHIEAVDDAELSAAIQDRYGELSAASSDTNLVFYTRQFETDTSITNSWGGYSNVVISGGSFPGSPTANGTYVFCKRYHGQVYMSSGKGIFCGAYIDAYTNTAKAGSYYRWLFDCGPSGASVVRNDGNFFIPTGTKPQRMISWALMGQSFGTTNIASIDYFGYYTPAWKSISESNLYSSLNLDGFSDTLGTYTNERSFTFSTSGIDTSRVQFFSPVTLRVYTNTILTTFDHRHISGIRSGISNCVNDGTVPCFIGPTNIGSTYDGVTEFPLVSTSAWRTVWTNWTKGNYVFTNRTVYTNQAGTTTTDVTSVWTNGNCSIQITTNELAWHYSALYRLRDMQVNYSSVLSSNYEYLAQNNTNDAVGNWNLNKDAWDTGAGIGGSGEPDIPHGWIACMDMSGFTNCWVDIAACAFIVSPIYTNVSHTVEFYALARVSDFYGGWVWNTTLKIWEYTGGDDNSGTYNPFDTTPIDTNKWKLFSTVGPTFAGAVTSAYYGGWSFPDVSLATNGPAQGWQAQVVPIIRWHQRACSNNVFDARY